MLIIMIMEMVIMTISTIIKNKMFYDINNNDNKNDSNDNDTNKGNTNNNDNESY